MRVDLRIPTIIGMATFPVFIQPFLLIFQLANRRNSVLIVLGSNILES